MSKVYVYRCIKLYVPFSTTVSTLLLQYVLLFATLCVSYLTFRAFRWNNLALYVTLERCHNITPGAGCRQAESPRPVPSSSLREIYARFRHTWYVSTANHHDVLIAGSIVIFALFVATFCKKGILLFFFVAFKVCLGCGYSCSVARRTKKNVR